MTLLRYSCYLIAVFCSLIGVVGRMPYMRSRQHGGRIDRQGMRMPFMPDDEDDIYAMLRDDNHHHQALPPPDLPVTTIGDTTNLKCTTCAICISDVWNHPATYHQVH